MKTRNNNVSVIPAHAGIPFQYQSGDSCMCRNDKKLKFSHSLTGRNDRNNAFETSSSFKNEISNYCKD
ncbi:MAG: hypothetical protein NT007_17300 [Candidatus Kapabacteria bacterium]|nr:hypothetical protein [Candidatus Kapabacteria bacterium]